MRKCHAYRVGDNLAVTVDVGYEQIQAKKKDPIAIHFVLDNSGSMGTMTQRVLNIFSEMVDSIATAPCSLTVFHSDGETLMCNIQSTSEMRKIQLPPQGMTNIPAGVKKAIEVINRQEMDRMKSNRSDIRIHHILILLSDGQHNSGESPEIVFPTMNNTFPGNTRLSTVVVGLTQNSSTSMGMLLKQSIETVAFHTDVVQPIYFARNKNALKSALENVQKGLRVALEGTYHEISMSSPCIIQDFASEFKEAVRVHIKPDTTQISLLFSVDHILETIAVDGEMIDICIEERELDFKTLYTLLQDLIDRTKIKIVASKNRGELISKSVEHLQALYKILHAGQARDLDLSVASLSAKQRLERYRAIRKLCHETAVLKNQILDIANFSNNDSESQASFLNGRSMKFANKALRRAAKRGEGVLDPKVEQKALHSYLVSQDFCDMLHDTMTKDVVQNLLRLTETQLRTRVLPIIQSRRHFDYVWEIYRKGAKVASLYPSKDLYLKDLDLSSPAENLIVSGMLAEYLNEALHGERRSYVSMSSSWQHLQEWLHFQDQQFNSVWEMLMYGGFVGYPIVVGQRSAASQMNPYLLEVLGVNFSIIDSASICCANQAEIPVYGPEAGQPIEDVLVLIDPSLPLSSKLICNSVLLGEKFTSVTVSRDLHMYSGLEMRLALHANTLLYLMMSKEHTSRSKENIVADLRRAYLGRSFMCPRCKYGPVEHFACSDLMTHHGDWDHGTRIDNSCPKCSWFSQSLHDWERWDGEVSEDYLRGEIGEDFSSPNARSHRQQFSFARIDMILRIVYSFRKTCRDSPIWGNYQELANRMVSSYKNEIEMDFSSKAGVNGLAQIAMALLGVLSEIDEDPMRVFKSKEFILTSIVKEACSRDARKRFRQESSGDKELTRKKAIEFCTKLLGIVDDTVPETQPIIESEPPIENVRFDCRDDYRLDLSMTKEIIPWIRDICRKWCRVWSFAETFNAVLSARTGGWDQLEKDMETGTANYADVVEKLQEINWRVPREVFFSTGELNDSPAELSDLQHFFIELGVEAILIGAGEASPSIMAIEGKHTDVLGWAAREMRMHKYLQRVTTKMAQWRVDGKQETLLRARAADLEQYSNLITKPHVHGLNKQTFWGLWLAAVESSNRAKVETFLATCNDSFSHKHSGSWEGRHGCKLK